MNPKTLITTALVGLMAIGAPAFAGDESPATTEAGRGDTDRDRLREQDMDQLRTHLRTELKLPEAEITGLEPECDQYFRRHGEQANLRPMLRAGWDAGCHGACLQEMVRSTTRAMVWGMQDVEATDMVTTALRDQLRERDRLHEHWTDAQTGDRLHEQVQDRLRTWERDRERLMDDDRLHEQERTRERERDRAGEPKGGSGR